MVLNVKESKYMPTKSVIFHFFYYPFHDMQLQIVITVPWMYCLIYRTLLKLLLKFLSSYFSVLTKVLCPYFKKLNNFGNKSDSWLPSSSEQWEYFCLRSEWGHFTYAAFRISRACLRNDSQNQKMFCQRKGRRCSPQKSPESWCYSTQLGCGRPSLKFLLRFRKASWCRSFWSAGHPTPHNKGNRSSKSDCPTFSAWY